MDTVDFISRFAGVGPNETEITTPPGLSAGIPEEKKGLNSLLNLWENKYLDANGNIIFQNTSESTQNTGNSKGKEHEFGQ